MEENNINITPEMISNLTNILKNNSSNNSNKSKKDSDNNDNNEKNNSNPNTYNTNNIDIETILKMKSMLEELNKKDDPRSNLLYSLKPYLRKTRQEKIDEYINLFKITKITEILKNEKGG